MALILDEAWAKVDPAWARSNGYTGIIGYVSEDVTGKNLTRAQVDAIHAAGMDVGLVYEYAIRAAQQGAARGAHDGDIARVHARSIGAPSNVTLYCAVDFDAQAADMPNVIAYVAAFRDQVHAYGYRAGVYGGYAVCWAVFQANAGVLLWQTYAWSHGLWCKGLAVRQTLNGVHVGGVDVDQDQTQVADWGQWPAMGTPGNPKGADVSNIVTDNVIKAWSEGDPSTVDDRGQIISVEPVKWRIKDEAWQATVTSALASLAAAVGQLGASIGGLTADQSADLHTIADDLRKLTG